MIVFKWVHDLVVDLGDNAGPSAIDNIMENNKKSASGAISFFKMPLHYPRYTKKDYQDMPEWKVDKLLSEYGLSASEDLAYKRKFAMGAFLWRDDHCQEFSPQSGP
ncbi:hypothetical protein QYF36_008961 [Acer negundo]|nr:hypothetical protein QYF36_008961 [Acer negundo]